MKNLIIAVLFAVTLLVSVPSHARSVVAVKTPERASFVLTSGQEPSLDKVRQCIGLASAARGWRVVAEQPGQLTLHNDVRGKHQVEVKVTYDSRGIQVDYVSSENLNYRVRDGVGYIHPKYNEWVNLLISDIVAKVSF